MLVISLRTHLLWLSASVGLIFSVNKHSNAMLFWKTIGA